MGYPTQKPLTLLERIVAAYTWPVNGQTFRRVQVITVADLLAGKRPRVPQLMLHYIQASRAVPQPDQMDLFAEAAVS